MKRRVLALFAILSSMAVLCGSMVRHRFLSEEPAVPSNTSTDWENYWALPLQFEANLGQLGAAVDFAARGQGYSVLVGREDAAVAFAAQAGSATLRMQLRGSDSADGHTVGDELSGRVNYLTGTDRTKWRTNVPTYRKVRYENVYPGIDLVFYGNGRELEYDFTLGPAVDPAQIRMIVNSSSGVGLDLNGDLVFAHGGDEVRLRKPVAYQTIDGARIPVAADYVLREGHEWGFQLGDYDREKDLVIDPVVSYATHFGGTSSKFIGFEQGYAVGADASGNMYVTGHTQTVDFPSLNPVQPMNGGGLDVFVTKLNAEGSALVFSTYLGGLADDTAYGLDVDGQGNVFIAGITNSDNFPTVSPFQAAKSTYSDGFIAKLHSSGSTLLYSTYFGGNGDDGINDITVDASGNAYVTGFTYSTDFPTTDAFQPSFGGGLTDAFVTKLSASGSSLVYSTYLGGSDNEDFATALAVDASGNAYVTGWTKSFNFPVTFRALQHDKAGTGSYADAFVTRLSTSGKLLVYSTFLGGALAEQGLDIAVDSAKNTYVTGWAQSEDFPVVAAVQPFRQGSSDSFVAKVNPTGSALIFSTYLGGTNSEGPGPGTIAIDGSGNVFVTGRTQSTDFPLNHPVQACGTEGGYVLTEFDPAGSSIHFSSCLSMSLEDIAIDNSGAIVLAGSGCCWQPTSGAFQTPSDEYNVAVMRISEPSGPQPALTRLDPASASRNSIASVTLTGTDFAEGATNVIVTGDGVTVRDVTVSDPASLTATFTVASTAILGSRNVFAITPNGGSNALTFDVVGVPPTLTSINIPSGAQGTTLGVTLTGTHFQAGATTVNISGAGVDSGMVDVLSETSLTVQLMISESAAPGPRDVTVTTPAGTSNSVTFTVIGNSSAPTLNTISPVRGSQGETLAVTLTGTDFVLGGTTVSVSGSDVTADMVSVSSGSSLTAMLTIGAHARIGQRDVTVTTSNGTSNAVTFVVTRNRRE